MRDLVKVSETPKAVPRVAVLLATYNGEKYLGQQLDTILSQTNVYVDVIISDDASSDCTVQIINDYIKRYENISLQSSGRKFGSAAQNFFELIKMSDVTGYDYVAFADQDDIWFSEKLKHGIEELVESGAAAISSDVIAFWPRLGKTRLVKKSYTQTPFDFWFESPGPGCTHIFRQTDFIEFSNFCAAHSMEIKEIDYHDWLVYAFFRMNGKAWVISKNPLMYYRQHESNQIGANIGLASGIKRLSALKSRWYRRQVNLIYRLVANKEPNMFSFWFITRHCFTLRRRKTHSAFLAISYLCGIL